MVCVHRQAFITHSLTGFERLTDKRAVKREAEEDVAAIVTPSFLAI